MLRETTKPAKLVKQNSRKSSSLSRGQCSLSCGEGCCCGVLPRAGCFGDSALPAPPWAEESVLLAHAVSG